MQQNFALQIFQYNKVALFPIFINYKEKFQYIDINLISQSYSFFICDNLLLEAQKGTVLFLLKDRSSMTFWV